MLEILLSSGSFDEKYQNLNMVLLSLRLWDHLEQLGSKSKKLIRKLNVLTTRQVFMQHFPKVKAKFQMIKDILKTV